MGNLEVVRNYCVGTAESEASFMNDVYFDTGKYQEILQVPTGSPILLIGKKGTGKSILINMLKYKLDGIKAQNIIIKPDNLENIDKATQFNDIANLKRIYFDSLITTLAIKLGESIKLALTRKDKKLYEKAIAAGAKDKNLFDVGLRYLANVGSVITDVQLEKLIPDFKRDFTSSELKRSLTLSLKNKSFWLFIDDTDQIAQLNNRDQLNRIWALLLSVRQLCEQYQNIKCIVTLRTEIWQILVNDTKGQRDQVDHFKRLIRVLDPSDDQIRDIIRKRIHFIEAKLGLSNRNVFSPLFEGNDISLPQSTEKRYWDDFLVKSSRQRPRDSIQLIDILAKYSIDAKFQIIKESIIEKALKEYSRDRLDDLAMEFANDSESVIPIVKSFTKCNFSLNCDQARDHISVIPSMFSLVIRGHVIKPGSQEDFMFLWNFLHELGFLNPCVPDSRMPKGFRHIMYNENPSYVSVSNLNEMRASTWEVHPAYRSYLLKEIEDEKSKKDIGMTEFFQARKVTAISTIFDFY
jgi:ABC-type antimicrobial peptide transport system, ATPase component